MPSSTSVTLTLKVWLTVASSRYHWSKLAWLVMTTAGFQPFHSSHLLNVRLAQSPVTTRFLVPIPDTNAGLVSVPSAGATMPQPMSFRPWYDSKSGCVDA